MKISVWINKMPSDRKKIFSLVMALILTVLIVTVWLLLDNYFAKNDNVRDIKSEENMNQLKESFQNIFKSVDNISNIIATSTNIINAVNATNTNQ